jgi:putative PEP-CTERM system TPR-repeat lipoprotein
MTFALAMPGTNAINFRKSLQQRDLGLPGPTPICGGLFALSLEMHHQPSKPEDRVRRITMDISVASFHPKECASAVLIALICVGCSRDPHAAMLKYAKSGDAYAAAGKTAEAIIQYRNAIEKDPRAGDVRLKLADAYLKQGEAAKGLEEYIRAADALSDTTVQLKAGVLLLMARRFDDAKVRAEKVLSAEPKNVDAQVLLANALAGLKDLDRAVSELEEAIQLNPDRSATFANLGQLEFGRGRHDVAEQAFKRAVELAPKSAASHLAMGSFYWATSRFAEAETELTEALTTEPDNVLALRAVATFYLATNRRDQAAPPLRRIYELTKSEPATLALADVYVLQKRDADARSLLEPLTKDPKTVAAASMRLAMMDRAAGRGPDAYKRVESILSGGPKQLQALILKGAFLLEDGKLDDALTAATSAVEAHPDALAAFSILGRVQAARHQPDAAIAAYQEAVRLNPLATGAKVALARLQLAKGRPDSSVGLAEEALKAEPQNADARLVLVQALIRQGDLQRAQADLDVLRVKYPDSAPVHVQSGMLLGRKRQLPEARREFERALQLAPDSLEAIGGLVALDLSTQRAADARARVDALVKAPSARPAALMLAGRTYAATGDLKTSEELFRRVVNEDPAQLSAYAALGQVYAKQHRIPEALAEFETLAKRDPKPVVALTLVGMLLESQGDKAGAQQRYERVVQLDPNAAVAANNLAWMYVQNNGNLDVALQLAQSAKRQLPSTPEVNDTLGYIYYKKDLAASAVPLLQSTVEKDPTNPEYHYHLGLAYGRSGDKSKASESLSRALSLKPDFSGAQDARAVLASLKESR